MSDYRVTICIRRKHDREYKRFGVLQMPERPGIGQKFEFDGAEYRVEESIWLLGTQLRVGRETLPLVSIKIMLAWERDLL